jgi:hypothetical protein
MKFIKFSFKSYLLLLSIFLLNNVNSYSDKNTFETANLIKNELDALLVQLEPHTMADALVTQPESNQDFTDKMFDAFKSLDRDLVLYNDIISRSKKGGLKEIDTLRDMFIKFDDIGDSDQCEVHHSALKGNFYLDVEEITNQIEKTTGSLTKIHRNEKETKSVKEKLKLVSEMKKKLVGIKTQLNDIKKNKFDVKQKLHKIRHDITCLINLIDHYKQKEKNVKNKLDEDLLKIKDEFDASEGKSKKVEKYTKIFHKMEDYFKKLNHTEIDTNNFNSKIYDNYIKRISKLDNQSSEIKKKIDQKVQMMNSLNSTMPIVQRLRKLNKIESIIKRLRKLNKKIIYIKKVILHKLKNLSFRNLHELMSFINKKKNITLDKHNKLVHFRNAVHIGKQIFSDKSKVEDVKKSILDNLRKAHENIEIKKEKLEQLKQKLNETKNLKLTQTNLVVNKSNLYNVKKKLIKRYLALYSFLKELKKLRNVLQESKDRIELNEKIKITKSTMKQIKLVIHSTKKLIADFKQNKDNKEIENQYSSLVNEVHQLKIELNDDQNIDNHKLEMLRSKLDKLSKLYKYLKKGDLHNFVQSEILKKIVNIDLNVQDKLDLKKLKKEVELLNK